MVSHWPSGGDQLVKKLEVDFGEAESVAGLVSHECTVSFVGLLSPACRLLLIDICDRNNDGTIVSLRSDGTCHIHREVYSRTEHSLRLSLIFLQP